MGTEAGAWAIYEATGFEYSSNELYKIASLEVVGPFLVPNLATGLHQLV